jgi:hypothetical protein
MSLVLDNDQFAISPVGFQKSVTAAEQGASRRSLVLVDQAIKNWTACDPFVAGIGNGVSRLGWAKAAGTVRSAAVVVPNIFREHCTQVPLVEDQHAVGEFGSDRAYEPFGKTVRPRATWRNPDHTDAHIGQDGIE